MSMHSRQRERDACQSNRMPRVHLHQRRRRRGLRDLHDVTHARHGCSSGTSNAMTKGMPRNSLPAAALGGYGEAREVYGRVARICF